MSHKVHHDLQGNVPFSWENKPGVSKVIITTHDDDGFDTDIPVLVPAEKLPPPPCRPTKSGGHRPSFHELQVPLPPCGFQLPARSSSKRGLIWKQEDDDPFLNAYKECTKSTPKSSLARVRSCGDGVGFGWRMKMCICSCKHSCSVRDDSTVRISMLPNSKNQRRRGIKRESLALADILEL